MPNEETDIFLSNVEPMLAVSDLTGTLQYWHDVLGFTNKWTWGEPPNHGGVHQQGVFIQFSLNPELAAHSKGNAIFIRAKNVEALYYFHQSKNAEIVEPLENKPWGMADYTVREINGYYVVFAGSPISERIKRGIIPQGTISIIERIPTVEEYLELIGAVGWEMYQNHLMAEKILSSPIYGVVAEANKQIIGCALLLSDEASFYYVKDVIVHPNWQRKGVGSMLMKQLTQWLDKNAPENAYVGLFTGENLSSFYKQFDFVPVFGMHRRVKKKLIPPTP